MAASSRVQVLRLYRALLRESQRFSSYNYRTYAIRRIRDAFRENKNIADSEKIEELLNKAKANLEVIQRQTSYIEYILGLLRKCLAYASPVVNLKAFGRALMGPKKYPVAITTDKQEAFRRITDGLGFKVP
ncbi:LYR motif-containing protein 4 isoform X1 [Turdus rufiventris]|nr:LYR motif-containing protein 4 isoform X1 [Turdus rufiventris]